MREFNDHLRSCVPDEYLEQGDWLESCERQIKRKGIYLYEYMDSFDRFKEKELPNKEDFYFSLNDEHISDNDYIHANNMWNLFKCKNLGDYHDLYLRTDVLLLADVFEEFRNTRLSYYKLDPAHYFSTPGFALDSMLNMEKIELDLLMDIDMHLMIEKGTRGAIRYIGHRYAKANNKYLDKYNSSEDSNYIIYLDANNLYGWAMSQKLPTGKFRWVQTIPEDPDTHFIECDLCYPRSRVDMRRYNEYPLAPERAVVQDEWLSDYQKNLKKKLKTKSDRMPKLLCTLRKKKKNMLCTVDFLTYT